MPGADARLAVRAVYPPEGLGVGFGGDVVRVSPSRASLDSCRCWLKRGGGGGTLDDDAPVVVVVMVMMVVVVVVIVVIVPGPVDPKKASFARRSWCIRECHSANVIDAGGGFVILVLRRRSREGVSWSTSSTRTFP